MVQSVLHALAVLECFERDPVLGISEMSRRTGLPKSTVHNLVQTLVARHWLRRTSTGRYQLGTRLVALGSLVFDRLEITEVAEPILRRLERQFRETVHLAVVDGGEVFYVHKIEADRSVRMSSRVGRTAALHCTGAGKLLLAFRPELWERALATGLPPRTARTITDPAALQAELARIRQQGYAVDNEETEESLLTVAVPVYDYSRQAVAAITVAGPSTRMRALGVEAVAQSAQAAGRQLSQELGFLGRLRSE